MYYCLKEFFKHPPSREKEVNIPNEIESYEIPCKPRKNIFVLLNLSPVSSKNK